MAASPTTPDTWSAVGEAPTPSRGVGRVFERSGPAAAVVADPPVLERPCREAALGERRGEGADVGDVVLGAPAAAVDHDRDRERTFALRHLQLAELERIGAVGDA